MISERYLYLIVDLACLAFPLFFSFFKKFYFIQHLKRFAIGSFITGSFFIVWDIIFTAMGVWSFNPRYLCGIYFFNLPIEEVLFFFFIPYASVFTWYCMQTLTQVSKFNNNLRWVALVLGPALFLFALFHLPQLYTSITLLLTGMAVFIVGWRNPVWTSAFFLAFLLILIPFFVSNGILTGAFTDEPVVLYNNHHNLGIRMVTIPVEDTFYGMLLILGNIAGFHIKKGDYSV
jgi:lycopene cyclase domain-containing protein